MMAEMTSAVAPSESGADDCPLCGSREVQRFLKAPDRFHGRRVEYQLMRCGSCSVVWQENPPAPENMGEHYGADYDRSVAAAGDSPERWRDRVQVIAGQKSGGSLLDLGCSSGGFLKAMQGPAWKLHGIEMSPEVARRAEEASGGEVFVGEILDAPYPPASFDVITCFHVLEHVYDPRAVLSKVQECLKPGGIFYIMIPNIDSAGARMFRSYWYALELPRHLYHFTPKSLNYLGESVGLEKASLVTSRELFFEDSVRYLVDEACQRAGVPRAPRSSGKRHGIPYRAARKAFRLTLLRLIAAMAALVGDGESIHGIFRKPGPPESGAE